VAQASDGELSYLGKVGTGFDERLLNAVSAELKKLTKTSRLIKPRPVDDSRSIWVEPKLMCEVQFASRTNDGMLREPVFVRLRPDLAFEEHG
jgi:bifunctional non-homologous end joining protein LigD